MLKVDRLTNTRVLVYHQFTLYNPKTETEILFDQTELLNDGRITNTNIINAIKSVFDRNIKSLEYVIASGGKNSKDSFNRNIIIDDDYIISIK